MIKNHPLVKNQRGSMLVVVFVATGLFIMITMGGIGLGILQQKLNVRKVARAQALHIAEAGVNYYRWVLYHNDKDYCNSETCINAPDYGPYGPYEYEDSAGNGISGFYELYITPPQENGSTIVKIKSVGWVAAYPNIKRSIEVQCGIPSWSTFSTLSDSDVRFGEDTEVWGPIHSNGGIRFDGLAHNLVSSLVPDYDDPDHCEVAWRWVWDGDEWIQVCDYSENEFGVHTHIFPTDPLPDGNNPHENVPERSDIFMAGRSFPTTIISFDLMNNYANEVYSMATTSGIVFDPRNSGTADPYSYSGFWGCLSSTCDEGFHITLKTDNTFDIRKVSGVRSDCSDNPSNSINSESSPVNFPIPDNGIIFVKNNIWISGQINNSRVTIIAFEDPFVGGNTDIYITNDVLYTNYDGTDAIGLIAQRDVSIGQYSEDNLRVDSALIAKSGRIGREYYDSDCENYIRDTITINGSLATSQRYGFAYTDGTGYHIRNLIYDNNLTFAPPPHFPTTGEYTFISWKEE